MARRAVEERILNIPIDVIVQKMRNVGSEFNFALRSENPIPTGVWFRIHHGASFTSWGEKVTVTLTPMGQQTKVNILSECGMPTQLIDYGKNRKVVNYLFDYIMRPGFGQPAPAPVQNQQMAQQPAPAPVQNQQVVQQPAPAPVNNHQAAVQQPLPMANPPYPPQTPQSAYTRFCTSCGNPVSEAARFCTRCGKQL